MLKFFLSICITLMLLTSCQKPSSEISLAGKWQFAMDHMIGGVEAEAVYGAHTLFLGLASGDKSKK